MIAKLKTRNLRRARRQIRWFSDLPYRWRASAHLYSQLDALFGCIPIFGRTNDRGYRFSVAYIHFGE